MRILDSYILKKTALSYLFILSSFIGLHVIVDLFSHLADFLSAKTPVLIVGQYYLYFLPLIFLRTSTFSLPISILFSLGELNKNNEITTMRASGISLIRLALPILFFSLFLSALAFFVQEKILIHSQKKCEDIKIEFIENNKKTDKIETNFVFRNNNQLIFVSRFIPQKNLLRDVIILKEDTNGIIREKMIAQAVRYNAGKWTAFDIISYKLDETGRIIGGPFAVRKIVLPLDEKPQTLAFKKTAFSEYLPLRTLRNEIKKLKRNASSAFLNNLIINYHKKIAEPLSHLFLAIGILPIALEIKKRKVGLSALGGGFIFGFIYYLLFSVSIALGKAGVLIGPLSSWMAPLFFLAVGISGLVLIK